MPMIVGIDASGPSRAALAWAMRRAEADSGELVLVHVVDDEWGQVGQDFADDEAETGARLLQDAQRTVHEYSPTLRVTPRLVHGSPAWELAAVAQPGDTIVVGTHKTGYVHGRALGTMSIVTASIASCQVVVVPESTLRGRTGVVVGIASGGGWRDAVVVGALEAARGNQELSLVHSAPLRDEPDAPEGQSRELLAEAAALAVQTAPGLAVRSRISRRRPAEALLDASHNAAMLVLGPSRHSPDKAGFLGSVTHDVLLNINTTVLVARSGNG
ncbi:universal stress protein [soil metagenome]